MMSTLFLLLGALLFSAQPTFSEPYPVFNGATIDVWIDRNFQEVFGHSPEVYSADYGVESPEQLLEAGTVYADCASQIVSVADLNNASLYLSSTARQMYYSAAGYNVTGVLGAATNPVWFLPVTYQPYLTIFCNTSIPAGTDIFYVAGYDNLNVVSPLYNVSAWLESGNDCLTSNQTEYKQTTYYTASLDGVDNTVLVGYAIPDVPFNVTAPQCNEGFVDANNDCATDSVGNAVTPNADGSIDYQVMETGFGVYLSAKNLTTGSHVGVFNIDAMPLVCGGQFANDSYVMTVHFNITGAM